MDRIKLIIGIDLDVKIIYTNKKVPTKVKSFKDKIRTFRDDGLPSERTPCTGHLILNDSVYRSDEIY